MNIRSPLPLLVLLVCSSPFAAGTLAQAPRQFAERPKVLLDMPRFSDRDLTALGLTLDDLLAHAPAGAAWVPSAKPILRQFVHQLQAGRLTSAQEARVLAHLDDVGRDHPAAADIVQDAREMVRTLTIGKTAPPILGQDLDGADLRLSDYRGKVTVVVFSAEWCAICRTQYPYERLLLELYKNWPMALVGVETGSSRNAVRQSRVRERLAFRAWWDEPREVEGAGPIADAWHVDGFPALYVLDATGVIRFVDLRDEDLLKAVRQLLDEQIQSETPVATRAAR